MPQDEAMDEEAHAIPDANRISQKRYKVKKDVKNMKKMLLQGVINSRDYKYLYSKETMRGLIKIEMTEQQMDILPAN